MPSVELPFLGLGLSSNLDPRGYPNPYHLIDRHPGLFDYVEYSAPLALAEARRDAGLFAEAIARRTQLPLIFHPVFLNLYGPELEDGAALQALREHLQAVGSPWVGNDVGWWHGAGKPFPGFLYLTPSLDEAGLADAVIHASHVQASLDRPLLLENPVVVARHGEMHVCDFMAELHRRTLLPLLLDLGHLASYQLTAGLPLDSGLDRLPLEQVLEIHIAGAAVTERDGRRFYFDDHTQPVRQEALNLLARVLPRCPNLRALTFEGDGHPEDETRSMLLHLRAMLGRAKRTALSWPLSEVRREGALSTGAWDLFAQVFGAAASHDVLGQSVETDFRLAVLAEMLDRRWPLTRLVLTGTRAALSDFCASPEFRRTFERGGESPDVPAAFVRYARRRLGELPTEDGEIAATALAFETVCAVKAKEPPEGQLASGMHLASFPLDLGEALFAARALRRHLGARALASGLYEQSGFEGVKQALRRRREGPFYVIVRDDGPVFPLDAELTAVVREASAARAPLPDSPALLRARALGLVKP
jgi:uncharacterized protein (UPF0276 family)